MRFHYDNKEVLVEAVEPNSVLVQVVRKKTTVDLTTGKTGTLTVVEKRAFLTGNTMEWIPTVQCSWYLQTGTPS
jgi:hypothetical protein